MYLDYFSFNFLTCIDIKLSDRCFFVEDTILFKTFFWLVVKRDLLYFFWMDFTFVEFSFLLQDEIKAAPQEIQGTNYSLVHR